VGLSGRSGREPIEIRHPTRTGNLENAGVPKPQRGIPDGDVCVTIVNSSLTLQPILAIEAITVWPDGPSG